MDEVIVTLETTLWNILTDTRTVENEPERARLMNECGINAPNSLRLCSVSDLSLLAATLKKIPKSAFENTAREMHVKLQSVPVASTTPPIIEDNSQIGPLEAPLCLESDHTSVGVAWDALEEAECYELALSTNEDPEWRSLSSNLKTNFIKKKNLVQGISYFFRIRFQTKENVWSRWSSPSEPMRVVRTDVKQMDAPVVTTRDGISLTVAWNAVAGADGYKLKYRQERSPRWEVIASTLRGTSARKKGLGAGEKYCFVVRPVPPAGSTDEYEYSPSSSPTAVPVLSPFMRDLLPRHLRSKAAGTPRVETQEALAGKVVAVYFSASWCGPCRNFTPQLAALYKQTKAQGKNFEVVFCSADHSDEDFESYYGGHMPWLAIPFEDDKKDQLSGKFQVRGIPKLSILSPTGRVIVDNAAGQPLTTATVDAWIQSVFTRKNDG